MHRTAAAALLAACLALAGCSSSGADGKPAPTATATATATPSLSAAEAAKACSDAWYALMTSDGYDPDAEPAKPTVCEGLPKQADMYMEALHKRNAANREKFDQCTQDPACTEWPIP